MNKICWPSEVIKKEIQLKIKEIACYAPPATKC